MKKLLSAFLFHRKFQRNFLWNKRHCVPEMRTRTKMKNVASDRARRENVPRHILSYVYGEPSADWCLHKVLHLVKGRCYRSTGTEKSLSYSFWWCQKTMPYYLMFYKKCTKDVKRRIQVRMAMKNKYVFKLYTYNKYNLAKTYKSCTIICNILRVENQVFFKVY